MSEKTSEAPVAPADPPQSGEDLVKQAREARSKGTTGAALTSRQRRDQPVRRGMSL